MARRKARVLTEVELEFMQVVWEEGEVTTEQLMDRLSAGGRELADGSVRKMLSILVEKGYLTRRREGRGFVYQPCVGREGARRKMVEELRRRAFGGSAALLVSALFDSQGVGEAEIAEIKELIARREKENRT